MCHKGTQHKAQCGDESHIFVIKASNLSLYRHILIGFLYFALEHTSLIIKTHEENPIHFCHWNSRYFAIRIHGLQPDHHYSVRQSTGDTLYADLKLDDSLYLILDDKYLPKLTGSSDVFTFHGYLDDSLIAREDFLITADECHIRVVDGNHVIEIKK